MAIAAEWFAVDLVDNFARRIFMTLRGTEADLFSIGERRLLFASFLVANSRSQCATIAMLVFAFV